MRAQQKRETLLEEQTAKYINKLCKKSETTESKQILLEYTKFNKKAVRKFMRTTMTKKSEENTEKEKKQRENYKEVLKNKKYERTQ